MSSTKNIISIVEKIRQLFGYAVLACFIVTIILVVSNTKNSYTSGNVTDRVDINITKTSQDSFTIEYNFLQDFQISSHGIFLSLPSENSGAWIDYTVKEITRKGDTSPAIKNTAVIVNNNIKDLKFAPEKYQQFKEINEFRVRVGDPHITMTGKQEYKIVLEARGLANSKINLVLLRDWLDKIDNINVYFEGNQLCGTKIKCTGELTQLTINPTFADPNLLQIGWSKVRILTPFILTFIVVAWVTRLTWKKYCEDPFRSTSKDHPAFEPPKKILPWEAQYLATEGESSFRDTLLSYILFLNHHKIITIKPNPDYQEKQVNSLVDIANLITNQSITRLVSAYSVLSSVNKNTDEYKAKIATEKLEYLKNEKILITILQPLPTGLLPDIFNTYIIKIADLGLTFGLMEAGVSPSTDGVILDVFLAKRLKTLYVVMPLKNRPVYCIFFAILYGIISLVVFNLLQGSILLGNSYTSFAWFLYLSVLLGAIFILSTWGKIATGASVAKEGSEGYKYYLSNVEKYKLNFSNNPDVGVQYYLNTVPFAAAFGILDNFSDYLKEVMPDNEHISSVSTFSTSYISSSVFNQSSSSSSGGSSGGGASGGGSSGGGGSW